MQIYIRLFTKGKRAYVSPTYDNDNGAKDITTHFTKTQS